MSWDVHWTMVFWMMDRTNLGLRRIIVSMRIMVGELLMEMWLCMSIMERFNRFLLGVSWMCRVCSSLSERFCMSAMCWSMTR